MDDLDPEKLWEDKGADYIAPYDEVLERVARWIESDLQEALELQYDFEASMVLGPECRLTCMVGARS